MTKEEIIRIAREARIEQDGDMFYSFRNSDKDQDVHIDDLVLFAQAAYAAGAAAAKAEEREACETACDHVYYQHIGPQFGEVRFGIAACKAAIRARGETTSMEQT